MSKKLTTEEFIIRARKVHGNKYDYSRTKYITNYRQVIIGCPTHGYFSQNYSNHFFGNGCPKCALESRSLKKKLNTEQFITKAKKIHGDKYDYGKAIYINSQTETTIVCPIHGEFTQRPNAHLSGRGCNKCSGNKKSTVEEFIFKARRIYGNKYDYSKGVYKNCDTELIIVCPIDGEFLQTPYNHLKNHGCPKCGNRTISSKQRYTKEQFVANAMGTHGNKYDYSKVIYINSQTEVEITCPVHGSFWQTPNNHVRERGCPECKKSYGELLVAKTLCNKNIQYIKQKSFKNCINPKTKHRLLYDFYLPQQNILIEFNGEQHYRHLKHWHKNGKTLEDQQYRDSLKKSYALSNGYKFLAIKYSDDVEQALKEVL